MASLQRTIKREMMFKGMNAKQKKLRRKEIKDGTAAKRVVEAITKKEGV